MNLFDQQQVNDDFKYILDGLGKTVIQNNINEIRAVITNKSVNEETDDKKITSLDKISCGDYIFDTESNITYLITSQVNGDRWAEKYRGYMKKCNHILKWQHECTVYEIPAVIRDRTSTGTDEDSYMTLGDGQYQITVQANEQTNLIKRDQRFLFNDSAWKISFIDKMEQDKISLTVIEDTISESTDRTDLGVADFVDCSYELQVYTKNISLNESETSQIVAEVYRNQELVDVEIVYASSDETIATVDENGVVTGVSAGIVTIAVTSQGITDYVNIEVTAAPVDNFSCEIIGDNSITVRSSEVYQIKWKNNGVEITDTIATAVIDKPDLATITVTGNQVTINANRTVGTITLTVTSTTNGIVGTKELQIKSLW